MTYICVSRLTIIGSDNGLSPDLRHAILWTNVGLLLIRPLGTNFIEISIDIRIFSLNKMHLKMSSGKWQPFCLGLNVLNSCFGCALICMVTSYGHGIIDPLWEDSTHKRFVMWELIFFVGLNTLLNKLLDCQWSENDLLSWWNNAETLYLLPVVCNEQCTRLNKNYRWNYIW